MALHLSEPERFHLQRDLRNAGLSQMGAIEVTNAQVVADQSDRAALLKLVAGLLLPAVRTRDAPSGLATGK